MYEVYLTIGVLLFLIGILMTFYFLCLLKTNKYVSTILHTTQAVTTILIGAFYVFSTIRMLTNLDNEDVKLPPFYNLKHGEHHDITEVNQNESADIDENQPFDISYINHVKEEDYLIKQFLIEHQEFLKNVTNKTYNTTLEPINKRVARMVDYYKQKSVFQDLYNNRMCSFNNLFLQHAMLLYSFTHTAITLINSTINCKKCLDNKINEESITGSRYKKLILILMILITPPLLTSTMYFTMNDYNENITSPQEYISEIIENPINVSLGTNESQANNIVRNIYEIIKEVQNNNINFVEHNVTQKYTDDSKRNCSVSSYNLQMSLKIQTFVIFIGGYFLIIIYSQSISSKLDSNNTSIKNLKVHLLGFSVLWFPSILELFTRVYFTKTIPDLTTELLSALGNSNHLITNVYNGMEIRKLIKIQNHVKPITEN